MATSFRAKLEKLGRILADRIPLVMILALIALYYIQLSNMVR